MKLKDEIAELAFTIRHNPRNEATELRIRYLADRHGDWVIEAIINKLTVGTPGTFPQSLQDVYRESPAKSCLRHAETIVASLDAVLDDYEKPPAILISTISELIPADFYRIPQDARLSIVEADVWSYWLQGFTISDIALLVFKRNGEPYHSRSLRKILRRAQGKVWNCPVLGWRTCLAEDVARGRRRCTPPAYVSWVEVVQGRRRHGEPSPSPTDREPV